MALKEELYMILWKSMDCDTARVLAERMTDYVAEDIECCAGEIYTDDDLYLAIGRYFRENLGIDV